MAARKLVTGGMSAVLAAGLLVVLSPSSAAAAADEITAPSDSAEIRKGPSVRIAAELGLAQSAELRLRGPADDRFHTVDEGWQEELAYRLDISCLDYRASCRGENPAPNGTYTVRVVDSGLLTSGGVEDERVFTLRVPPRQPRQVAAEAKGPGAVRLEWAAGKEPDLTAYDILDASGSRLERLDAGQACDEGSCSTVVNVPARAQERTAGFSIRARRSVAPGSDRTVVSRSSGKVAATIPAAPASDPRSSGSEAGDSRAPSQRQASPSASRANSPNLRPLASSSRMPLPDTPGRLDAGSERRLQHSLPTIPRPTPSPQATLGGVPPSALEHPQGGGVGDPRSMTSAFSMAPSQWWKTVALGLVLLLVAAHLGAWTWRTRPEPHRIGGSKKRGAGATGSGKAAASDRRDAGDAAFPGDAGETGVSYRGRRRRG